LAETTVGVRTRSDRDPFEASINLINCAFEVSDEMTAAALVGCGLSSK
jgi:hypothetical protein